MLAECTPKILWEIRNSWSAGGSRGSADSLESRELSGGRTPSMRLLEGNSTCFKGEWMPPLPVAGASHMIRIFYDRLTAGAIMHSGSSLAMVLSCEVSFKSVWSSQLGKLTVAWCNTLRPMNLDWKCLYTFTELRAVYCFFNSLPWKNVSDWWWTI